MLVWERERVIDAERPKGRKKVKSLVFNELQSECLGELRVCFCGIFQLPDLFPPQCSQDRIIVFRIRFPFAWISLNRSILFFCFGNVVNFGNWFVNIVRLLNTSTLLRDTPTKQIHAIFRIVLPVRMHFYYLIRVWQCARQIQCNGWLKNIIAHHVTIDSVIFVALNRRWKNRNNQQIDVHNNCVPLCGANIESEHRRMPAKNVNASLSYAHKYCANYMQNANFFSRSTSHSNRFHLLHRFDYNSSIWLCTMGSASADVVNSRPFRMSNLQVISLSI